MPTNDSMQLPNDILTDQQAAKALNDPVVADLVVTRKQVANPPANASQFQAWGGLDEHSKVVGTMVTGGDPRSGGR